MNHLTYLGGSAYIVMYVSFIMTQLENCIQFLDLKPNDYTAKIHNHKIIPSDHLENHNNYNFTVQKAKYLK